MESYMMAATKKLKNKLVEAFVEVKYYYKEVFYTFKA